MIPKRITGATRHLGAPKGWRPDEGGECSHLAILDDRMDGGMPVMLSAWEPTPAELEAMLAGAPVYLQVVGTAHPPVNVWVQAAQGMSAGTAKTAEPVEGEARQPGPKDAPGCCGSTPPRPDSTGSGQQGETK